MEWSELQPQGRASTAPWLVDGSSGAQRDSVVTLKPHSRSTRSTQSNKRGRLCCDQSPPCIMLFFPVSTTPRSVPVSRAFPGTGRSTCISGLRPRDEHRLTHGHAGVRVIVGTREGFVVQKLSLPHLAGWVAVAHRVAQGGSGGRALGEGCQEGVEQLPRGRSPGAQALGGNRAPLRGCAEQWLGDGGCCM